MMRGHVREAARFFAPPTAIQDTLGLHRHQSAIAVTIRLGSGSLDPDQAAGREGGLQHRPRARRPTIRICWRGAVPRAEIFGPTPRLSRHHARLFRPLLALGPRCIAPSRSTSASRRDFFDDKLRPAARDPAPAALSAGRSAAARRPARRRRAHRLRQRHAARHRRGRRPDGARPLRQLARSRRSIPDAFVCNIGDCLMRWTNDIYVSTPHKVVSPPGTRPLFDRVLPRSQSGRDGRMPADLHRPAVREIPAGHRSRTSSNRGWRRPMRTRPARAPFRLSEWVRWSSTRRPRSEDRET